MVKIISRRDDSYAISLRTVPTQYFRIIKPSVAPCAQTNRQGHYPGVDTLLFTMAFLALRCFWRCFNFFAASFAFDIWLIVCPLNAPALILPGLLWRRFGLAPFFPPVWSIAYNFPDRLPDTFALSPFFVLPPSKLLMLSELPARRRFPFDTCIAVSKVCFQVSMRIIREAWAARTVRVDLRR